MRRGGATAGRQRLGRGAETSDGTWRCEVLRRVARRSQARSQRVDYCHDERFPLIMTVAMPTSVKTGGLVSARWLPLFILLH